MQKDGREQIEDGAKGMGTGITFVLIWERGRGKGERRKILSGGVRRKNGEKKKSKVTIEPTKRIRTNERDLPPIK